MLSSRQPRFSMRSRLFFPSQLGCGRSLLSWGMLGWHLLGCSGDGSLASESGAVARTRYCVAVCAKRAECSSGAPAPGCVETCQNDPGARGRDGVIWLGQLDCIASQSCAEWASGSAEGECFALALANLTPSESCQTFCRDDAARSFECGGGYSVDDCVRGQTCSYRDEVLVSFEACNEELDCDARASCMAGVFGRL